MTISTVAVGAAVTPTVVKTYISHYANRKPRRHKPTAHISYDEGLHLIRTFLKYTSHHTVEDLQAFTAQWVPTPSWVRTENVAIPAENISKAARAITSQLGTAGLQQVGGSQWWQWRPKEMELKAEWIEMRAHYNKQKRTGGRSRRVMLYVHGGAYFFGSVDEHRYQMQRHARKLQARVFAPRYRLAPQFPFPCGLQDCLAAYLYLLSLHEPAEIIFAGDSAGGGMVVSLLCLLRDQSLPLPAGAILISPWVDMTHSFPSLVGSAELDYIPPHGFMHKPSMSWPPPNDHELSVITALAKGHDVDVDLDKVAVSAELHAGFSECKLSDLPESNKEDLGPARKIAVPTRDGGEVQPASQHYLSVELDGKRITLKDQIQMYTTNQLLAHPLVSPVLQPSLGGLPPVLILTGGGELLRDEQIYLAHKMANPSAYPLGSAYRSTYDPDDTILRKYRPTPVQLQVYEDLCHVATTLSFTRPAKFMYRSIAQFGAWALARAQRRSIEIMNDDNISIISSESDSDSATKDETGSASDISAKLKVDPTRVTGSVGRAGDALPRFVGNMIRQGVDRHGRTYPLADAHQLPALQLAPDDVGVVKPGPVRNWLEARKRWDRKYASASSRVRKERIRTLASGEIRGFEKGESPPPSALASRRTGKDLLVRKTRKSFGLAMWSSWGSRHDESTLRREEEAVRVEKSEGGDQDTGEVDQTEAQALADGQVEIAPVPDRLSPSQSREPSTLRKRSSSRKRRTSESRVRGRRQTVSVTDTGQAEDDDMAPLLVSPQAVSVPEPAYGHSPTTPTSPLPQDPRPNSPDPGLLSAGFIPKFKTAFHRRNESSGPLLSDTASNMTSRSGLAADDASTRAVFASPGVSKNVDGAHDGEEGKPPNSTNLATSRPGSPLMNETKSFSSEREKSDEETVDVAIVSAGSPSKEGGAQHYGPAVASSSAPAMGGTDTPRSQRSLERLQSHQHDEGMGRMQPLRSLSSTAVVRADGVVGIVDDPTGVEAHGDSTGATTATATATTEKGPTTGILNVVGVGGDRGDAKEKEKENSSHALTDTSTARPQLYDRAETTFQTAMERVS
ncbi:hypothetical protein A1O3_01641 [Capronia epimyces CBS 606.96]|uniref:Alpha/beta hydrolase fold-3 domain-containing protein n=1 Tax=Capronia epimyces CBS 606.96 TaxID=1182542 RepID=W9YTT8_9EURO|nr:uncharacterized protein A1O3_01641 [Capronia epimyces CBS 606.96]EXJ93085.1 hypothetical protein A1O3_01641 [Capronia epimyces CBS 606.96]